MKITSQTQNFKSDRLKILVKISRMKSLLNNLPLKKYLDFNRFSMAIECKIQWG